MNADLEVITQTNHIRSTWRTSGRLDPPRYQDLSALQASGEEGGQGFPTTET